MNSRRSAVPPGHLAIGQIVGTHGVHGGLRVEILTDYPERFAVGSTLWIAGEERRILWLAFHKTQARVLVDGITTCEAAEALKWVSVTIPADQRPELDDDEFLHSDLIGLLLVSEEGVEYGPIESIERTPAHDLLVVKGTMIPAVEEFIKEIDLEAGRVVVRLIPGLIPGEDLA